MAIVEQLEDEEPDVQVDSKGNYTEEYKDWSDKDEAASEAYRSKVDELEQARNDAGEVNDQTNDENDGVDD